MTLPIGICRAHTNIALIKYWGKRNEELFLPMNSSLSLTLDAFYTDTKVSFLDNQTEDQFYLNGQKQDPQATIKMTRFINLFRQLKQTEQKYHKLAVKVESYNHVPTAAGLASSASAFAALAGACRSAFNLNLDSRELSTLARQGSGSATRSLYGGFVEWTMGEKNNSSSSYAIPVDPANWDIGMLIIAINKEKKKISSREGMKQTIATSPFYPAWIEQAKTDLALVKKAIKQKDFTKLGEVTESNGMKMHATMLSAKPPFTYFEPDSLVAIQLVQQLRANGIPAYFTMDAGPNVKVLCRYSQIELIRQAFSTYFQPEQLITSKVGSGIKQLRAADWSY